MGEMFYVDYYLEKDQKEYLDNLLSLCGTTKENGKVTYYLEKKQKEAIDSLLNKEGIIVKDEKQWPYNGSKYYYLDDEGHILSSNWCMPDNIPPEVIEWDETYHVVDIRRHDIGNIFKTKEEAEFACEKLKVFNQLRNLSDDDQEWDNTNNHYYIAYNIHADKFDVWVSNYAKLTHGYWFKSEKSANAAIKTIGEDKLKKYVFNIKTM